MEAAAHTLARRAVALPRPEAIFASDFLDVARFRGFLPPEWARIPVVLYFHENQLTYPGRPGSSEEQRDLTHGFTNALSCAASEAVVFNSQYHLQEFSKAVEELFRRLPKPSPASEVHEALEQARVVGVGVDLEAIPLGSGPGAGAPLRIVFNHRFEHDKDPCTFLLAALALGETAEVEIILLGERFNSSPEGAEELVEALGRSIVHRGFAESRSHYAHLLGSADLVVSTARHEFYGVAMLEAVAAGCAPLAPSRLAYPEVLGSSEFAGSLYEGEAELNARLERLATNPACLRDGGVRSARRSAVAHHDVSRIAERLDEIVEAL